MLHCSSYSNEKLAFLDSIRNTHSPVLKNGDMNIIRTLPLGHNSFDRSKSSLILDTIYYAIKTGELDDSLFNQVKFLILWLHILLHMLMTSCANVCLYLAVLTRFLFYLKLFFGLILFHIIPYVLCIISFSFFNQAY